MKISTWLQKKSPDLDIFHSFWMGYYDVIHRLTHHQPFKAMARGLYWLRTHTWDRYHMIDIRNRRNGYAWGWLDRSEGLLFANMAMLADFIEKEHPFEMIDWDSDDPHQEAAKELREIYEWWTIRRKIEHDEHERRFDAAYEDCPSFPYEPTLEQQKAHEAVQAEEEKLDQRDTDMLIRLIKVRGAMWV